jgi:hypothetical protein
MVFDDAMITCMYRQRAWPFRTVPGINQWPGRLVGFHEREQEFVVRPREVLLSDHSFLVTLIFTLVIALRTSSNRCPIILSKQTYSETKITYNL